MWGNSEQHPLDMIVDSVCPEKKLVDQQVYAGTKSIKRGISENQPVNGQPKNALLLKFEIQTTSLRHLHCQGSGF